jgi:hypothetical protein
MLVLPLMLMNERRPLPGPTATTDLRSALTALREAENQLLRANVAWERARQRHEPPTTRNANADGRATRCDDADDRCSR